MAKHRDLEDAYDGLGVPDLRPKTLALGVIRRLLTPASWFGISNGTNPRYWIVNGRVQRRPNRRKVR